MNTFIVLLALFASALCEDDWKEKWRQAEEKYEEIKQTCADKFEVDVRELGAFDRYDAPTTKKDKCILECVFTEYGLMKDGQFLLEGADRMAQFLYGDDEESLAVAKAVGQKCAKFVHRAKLSDGCETASVAGNCLRKAAKQMAHKLDIDYKA